MNKVNNFKVYFSEILLNKYHFTKEGIEGYWENKEKEEMFDNRKLIGTLAGVGELVSAASLSVISSINNDNYAVPVIILGGIGFLTTKISLILSNPYSLSKYSQIDEEYSIEKIKYKKLNK